MGREGLLGGTTRNQDSHIQQTPDNQLRLQEILTLILETFSLSAFRTFRMLYQVLMLP